MKTVAKFVLVTWACLSIGLVASLIVRDAVARRAELRAECQRAVDLDREIIVRLDRESGK